MGRNSYRKLIQLLRSDDGSREKLLGRCAEVAAHNAEHSRLYSLPLELLATINDYLPLASGLALKLTCSKFYQSSVFNRTQRCADRTDRFKVLCLLECDGSLEGYCCKGCLTMHHYTAFSNEELAKKPHTRYCLRTMKCFRVGLFRELSFAELQEAYREQVESYRTNRQNLRVNDCNENGTLISQDGTIYFISRERRLYIAFFIGYSSQLSSAYHFTNFCRSLNIPFCPHMTMGDEKVTNLIFKHSDHFHSCKKCKTKVCFDTEDLMAYFFVIRKFGRLSSPKNSKWLAHTFASKDPLLETHCKAVHDWKSKNPLNSRKPLAQLQLQNLRTPGFTNQFKRVTLPRSRWEQWFHKQ
ncbi:predicted protein [Histoplasma capsulatum var. duboisii H88]|uniref:Predicted protein n=1 Tax=Ajellomyces capsulatus (strain H88) TaxID=544711 RepID=F0URC8_AJEC8|nr:predicted protein [Histoplasma capsulatum var. duboisii H88]QSS50475.1 hypothetical protein I7I53_11182 [Histoplasma capsulatum var. duboisii H88]